VNRESNSIRNFPKKASEQAKSETASGGNKAAKHRHVTGTSYLLVFSPSQ